MTSQRSNHLKTSKKTQTGFQEEETLFSTAPHVLKRGTTKVLKCNGKN